MPPVPQHIGPASRIIWYPEISPGTDPQGVATIAVSAGGSGYTVAPSVSVTDPTGQGFSGHAVLTAGAVTSIVVDHPGYGYTGAPPTATLTGGDGSGATAGAVALGAPEGFIMPIDGADTYFTAQPLQEAPTFTGPPGEAPDEVPGEITASGGMRLNLDFIFSGHVAKAFTGGSTVPVATAGAYMHYFPLAVPPLSGCVQKEWLDGTIAEYLRIAGTFVDTWTLPTSTSGAQKSQLALMGYGIEYNTATDGSLANLGGTKTRPAYKATSSFYGSLYQNNTSLATVVNFPPALSRKMSRQSVAFNGGIAGSINAGLPRAQGALELIYDKSRNLADYDLAVQATPVEIGVVWADRKLTSINAFLYLALPYVILERRGPAAGGEQGFTFPQNFKLAFDPTASQMPGFVVSANGPWTFVAATTDKLGIKIDGGGTQTITLTTGSSQTAKQVCATINATLTGGVAEVFPGDAGGVGGRFRIRTNTRGTSGSVAIDTTVTHSAHSMLGFDSVVRAGKAASSMHVYLLNSQSLQY